ncbi:MAG: hypothetical protein Kow0032_26400 [Methyloligellaceae bacterium]
MGVAAVKGMRIVAAAMLGVSAAATWSLPSSAETDKTAKPQAGTLSPEELDRIQKSFPQSTVPKDFFRRGKGPHGSGDPHAALGPGKLVKVALQHLSEGRRAEAMKTLNSGIERYPDDPQLRGIRGSIYLQHKEFAKALSDFEAGLKARPDDVLLLVNRAQTYRSFNRTDEALADLNRAIKLQPDLVAARFNRGALYLSLRKLEEARADFEHCVSVDPHEAAPRFNLAIVLAELGKREEAIAEMERFLKIARSDSWKKVAREQLAVWRKTAKVPEKSEGGGTREKASAAKDKAGKAN